jgi:hypothetical protein
MCKRKYFELGGEVNAAFIEICRTITCTSAITGLESSARETRALENLQQAAEMCAVEVHNRDVEV